MRNFRLPVSNAMIKNQVNEQPDMQVQDALRMHTFRLFLRRIMNVILAITIGTLLLVFVIRYFSLHYSFGNLHNPSMLGGHELGVHGVKTK